MPAETPRIVLFGAGRLGRSLHCYLSDLGSACEVIDRRTSVDERDRVVDLIGKADIVAAALPDDALAPLHAAWKEVIGGRPAIHFSGTAKVAGMTAYHPLYSFSGRPVEMSVMRTIVFARERGSLPLRALIPALGNPEIEIDAADRAYYHALAVLSGNFPAFLWNVAAARYRERFPDLPPDALATYFSGLVDRFREQPESSYTGPVARRDKGTVAANLEALKGDPKLDALYGAFLAGAWPEWPENSRK